MQLCSTIGNQQYLWVDLGRQQFQDGMVPQRRLLPAQRQPHPQWGDGQVPKVNGYNCFDLVLNSIDSNGGNGFSMFANPLSQCGQQGTVTPHILGFRMALVG